MSFQYLVLFIEPSFVFYIRIVYNSFAPPEKVQQQGRIKKKKDSIFNEFNKTKNILPTSIYLYPIFNCAIYIINHPKLTRSPDKEIMKWRK